MNRQEKLAQIDSLKSDLDGAGLVVVAEYAGLSVSDMVSLRSELRKSDSSYKVVKNTLARLAVKDSHLDKLTANFVGPIGVAYSHGDISAAAKAISDFAKDKPKFVIRSGVMSDGSVVDAKGLEALASLPSKEELQGTLLNTMLGVPRKLVGLFANVPGGFVRVLEARRKELEG